MKIYLAGPMTGLPAHNYPAFKAAAAKLRAQGYDVFNPAENQGPEGALPEGAPTPTVFAHYMALDLPAVCQADAVAFLPGWAASKGALLELHVAVQCDKQLFAYTEQKPHLEPL